MSSKKVLGRGLRALIPVADAGAAPVAVAPAPSAQAEQVAAQPPAPPTELPVALLRANPDQPRRVFDEGALARLADSIRQHGILQPILVRPMEGESTYQVVAGERRFLAAQKAGLSTVPVQLRAIDDEVLLETALVENIQRQDLTPLEEAEAYHKLLNDFALTQEQIAQKVGRDRSSIANSLRLLQLPQTVKTMLDQGRLTAGHARALLSLRHPDDMTLLAHEVVDKGMSVRQAEAKAKQLSESASAGRSAHARAKRGGDAKAPAASGAGFAATSDANLPAAVRALRDMLTTRLATRVLVQRSPADGRGALHIEFYSDDDLDRVASIILGE